MFEIRQVGANRGVYATQDIPTNTVIDTSPVITIPASEWDTIKTFSAYPNSFYWTKQDDAIVLGPLSLVNYADEGVANCSWSTIKKDKNMTLQSVQPIFDGDELTVFWTNIGLLDRV